MKLSRAMVIMNIVQLDSGYCCGEALNLDTIEPFLFEKGGRWHARLEGLTLSSVFQPIFSPAHQQCVGMEALVRVQDNLGNAISPPRLFAGKNRQRIVLADRICRLLHGKNYLVLQQEALWLTLNIAHEVAVHGRCYGPFLKNALASLAIPPESIVLEIMEHPVGDHQLLDAAVDFYRNMGCHIALDDFGAGRSHFDRVWRLNPHMVKLDRNLIAHAKENPRIRHIFRGMVSLLQQSGCLVLVEGVECEEEAVIALQAGADFIQGYYFARPSPSPSFDFAGWGHLYRNYHRNMALAEERNQDRYAILGEVFQGSCDDIGKGKDLWQACKKLLEHPDVLRCFCLTSEGHLLGEPLFSPHAVRSSPSLMPVVPGRARDNRFRPFLQNARRYPGKTCRTRPYRSFLQDGLCVTLSRQIRGEESGYGIIFCCDIREPWFDSDPGLSAGGS
ncbi:EAL domain-containing protein [Desulfobotulus sp. H1]|uniref:EAL domain-containing protein n=1 Tax=Desulfobotulus pelophilus TaxID=2823377 RepID=A0ABT3N965_9BACT|nr:EAL domain-containing protein [Desulfobotulus pelophilus]MCW7753996.1 EAL domain-containing protein [Desulfobotulus pelophilus]